MCLLKIKDFTHNKDYGYSTKLKDGENYRSLFYENSKILEKNKWLKATRKEIGENAHCRYSSGFHLFTSVASCYDWGVGEKEVVVKVKFRGRITKGIQGYCELKTIVAEYIKIIEEVK